MPGALDVGERRLCPPLLGGDSAGAREREEDDHEEDDRGDAERNVELGDQVVLPSRFFIHLFSLSVCPAARGRANLAGFTCPVDN